MDHIQSFTPAAKEYLYTFYGILDRMIQGMTHAEQTGSISYDFISQMIPHHEAAIEMSRSLLDYQPCPALRTIAQGIIQEQTESIRQMREIQDACAAQPSSAQDLCLYRRRTGQILRVMFSAMEDAPTCNQIDADFMREMIPHHRGAVEMSENALRYPLCPGLRPILQAIIVSQKRGIRQMERLLCQMGRA